MAPTPDNTEAITDSSLGFDPFEANRMTSEFQASLLRRSEDPTWNRQYNHTPDTCSSRGTMLKE